LYKTTILLLYSQSGLWDLFCIHFEKARTVLVNTERQIQLSLHFRTCIFPQCYQLLVMTVRKSHMSL